MQEEARHILFIVNWAGLPAAPAGRLAMRPAFDLWRGWNIVAQAFDRLKGALAMAGGDGKKKDEKEGPETGRDADQVGFTMKSHSHVRRLLPARVPRDLPRGERQAPRAVR